jgi:hypothetical protein
MLRNRILILLGASFLAASAARADDVGYVDCTNHPEDIQVFAKARKSPDVLSSVPCGERFTVLVYGFVFSRIQTKDGNVGYIYSNLIAVDRAATAAQQAGSTQLASAKVKVPSVSAAAARPAPAASVQAQAAPARPAPAQASAPASNLPEVTVAAQPAPSAAAQPQSAPTQSAPAQSSEPVSKTLEGAAVAAQPNPPAQPQPVPVQPAAAPVPAPSSNAPEAASAAAQPKQDLLAQPDPAPAQPASAEPPAAAIRPADTRTSWEKPRPGGVRRVPLLQLFGGYAFARLDGGGGTGTNVNGFMGSIGWNLKPWLQIVADSSYNTVTISSTKNILYGNHFGPRYFHRGHNRWGLTPFAEALIGGSRADTKVSGSPTYNTSQNCMSFKVGGGVDIHPSRHIDIRLFDANYYRTSFGTNANQNNYWISTGIVIRLFSGGAE